MVSTELALRDKRYLVSSDLAAKPPDGLHGYELALAAAGVKVLGYEQFGSYQGDWWARVEFPNHERYFITGSYGSCSGCDSFEAEFGWKVSEDDPDYFHRLRDFGRDYLVDCMTTDQALLEARKYESWDVEAATVVAWIEAEAADKVRLE